MGSLTASLTGLSPEMALITGSALVTVYTLLGGQTSVIRSDLPQYLLMVTGLGLGLICLLFYNPLPVMQLNIELFNEQFPPSRLWYFMIILGGSYVVCPMLFGRILSARDVRSAVSGCRIAIAGLILTAVIIVLIGIACRGVVPPETTPDNVLSSALTVLPSWARTVLLLALLSAVLSSADSCLITLSTICCHDLLHEDSMRLCRLVTLAAGSGSYLLSTQQHGILELMLMANDIYVCGAAAPLFLAIMIHERRRIPPGTGMVAVLCGGAGGLISVCSGIPEVGYAGILLSILCIFAGSIPRRNSLPPGFPVSS